MGLQADSSDGGEEAVHEIRGPSVLDIDSIHNPKFNNLGPQASTMTSARTATSLAGFNDQCQSRIVE